MKYQRIIPVLFLQFTNCTTHGQSFRVFNLIERNQKEYISGNCKSTKIDSIECEFTETKLGPTDSFSKAILVIAEKTPLDSFAISMSVYCNLKNPASLHFLEPSDCKIRDIAQVKELYLTRLRSASKICDLSQFSRHLRFKKVGQYQWESDTSMYGDCGYLVKTILRNDPNKIQEIFEQKEYRPGNGTTCPEVEKMSKVTKAYSDNRFTGLQIGSCESIRMFP